MCRQKLITNAVDEIVHDQSQANGSRRKKHAARWVCGSTLGPYERQTCQGVLWIFPRHQQQCPSLYEQEVWLPPPSAATLPQSHGLVCPACLQWPRSGKNMVDKMRHSLLYVRHMKDVCWHACRFAIQNLGKTGWYACSQVQGITMPICEAICSRHEMKGFHAYHSIFQNRLVCITNRVDSFRFLVGSRACHGRPCHTIRTHDLHAIAFERPVETDRGPTACESAGTKLNAANW